MAVVIHDQDVVGFAVNFEAALDTAKFAQAGRYSFEGETELQSDGDGSQRVQQVVPSRDLQRQRSEFNERGESLTGSLPLLNRRSNGESSKRQIRGGHVASRPLKPVRDDTARHSWNQRRKHLIVSTGHDAPVERDLVDEVDESPLQIVEVAIV